MMVRTEHQIAQMVAELFTEYTDNEDVRVNGFQADDFGRLVASALCAGDEGPPSPPYDQEADVQGSPV